MVATCGPSGVNGKNTQNQPDGYNYILVTQILTSSEGVKKKSGNKSLLTSHTTRLFLVCAPSQTGWMVQALGPPETCDLWRLLILALPTDRSKQKGLLWEDSACGNETQILMMVCPNRNLHDRICPLLHHLWFSQRPAPRHWVSAKANR